MNSADEKRYTVAEAEALDEKVELLDGKLYYMAETTRSHGRYANFISNKLTNHIEAHGGNCEVYSGSFAVYLDNGQDFVVPDITVVCDHNKLDEKGCHGAPDMVVEMISPSSREYDAIIKANKYLVNGVREYWVIDPEKKQVIKHDFENGTSTRCFPFRMRSRRAALTVYPSGCPTANSSDRSYCSKIIAGSVRMRSSYSCISSPSHSAIR